MTDDPSATDEDAEEPLSLGRYALYQAIGGGGMAKVHLGRVRGAAGFSRVVAIKRLHRSHARDPEFSKMLADEARLVSRIRHPNVVPTLDVVVVDGELLLVMEYVHGVALSRLVHLAELRNERIPLPIAVRIVLDLLAGLGAAHEAKSERGRDLLLVHRDVSPQNVLVGTDGVTRIVDFGIAKAEGKLAVTRDGQIKGKLSYMAPEQLRGEEVDRRTDLYSTGIVLWELATGSRLFNRTLEDVIAKKPLATTLTVERPSTRADVPAALDDVVDKALRPDAAARFETAGAMMEALDRACVAATTKEVAVYVTALAETQLQQRDELVARIEQTSEVYELAAAKHEATAEPTQPTLPERPARAPTTQRGTGRGRGWLLALGLVICAGAALFFLWRTTAASPTPTAPSSAPPPVIEATQSAPIPTPPMPEGSTTAPSAPRKKPLTSHGGTRAPAASVSAAPDCNPPFAIDARGIRVPRRECLGP